MKKTVLLTGTVALGLFLTGCEDKNSEVQNTYAKEQQKQQKQQNILDYTKIFKLNEKVEIIDPQNYTPGTIEFQVWKFIETMDSGNYKDCLPLLVPGQYEELGLKMWYENRFGSWDLDKPKSFTLRNMNGSFNCIFEGYSSKHNKEHKVSYYIVIKDDKVWITGKSNIKTF